MPQTQEAVTVSLLIDPPLLVATGAVIGRSGMDEGAARRTSRAALALFWGVSVPLYCNAPWMRRFVEAVGAETGRDFMLGSGLVHVEHDQPSPLVHAVAVAVLASYPLWLRLGRRLGGRR